jgi:DNA helicase-2/ATP-dependent DNA helicase PcrA
LKEYLQTDLFTVLGDLALALAKPVVRHGPRPTYTVLNNPTELGAQLTAKIEHMVEEGFKSIAIISKTFRDGQTVAKGMKKHSKRSCVLLEGKEEFRQGICILPSYLAKGLKFDAVIIIAMDDEYTMDDLDIKLLYVAMTRPLHEMHFLSLPHKIQVLDQIKKDR